MNHYWAKVLKFIDCPISSVSINIQYCPRFCPVCGEKLEFSQDTGYQIN